MAPFGKAHHYCSKDAAHILKQPNPQDLVRKHVVPVSVINGFIYQPTNPTESSIEEIIRESSVLAIITKGEDQALSNAHLRKRMPRGWDGCDKLARYKMCGIELIPLSA